MQYGTGMQLDYRGAIGHYTLAIETAKTDLESSNESVQVSILASYYSNRAAAFSMLLQYETAISDCDEAISVDPSFAKAHFRKARTLTTQGQVKEAIKAYSLGMIYDSNNAAAILDKDELLTLEKRFTLAKQIVSNSNTKKLSVRDSVQIQRQMDLILKTCPAWKEAIFLKAKALFFLRKTQTAYNLTTTLVRMGGLSDKETSQTDDIHDLVLLRALILFQMGNTDDSIKHLRQILGGDPDNKQAFAMLKFLKTLSKKKAEADIAYKSKNYESAISLYTDAIQTYTTSINVDTDNSQSPLVFLDSVTFVSKLHFNRASSHANLRQHTEAIQDCTKAIRLDESYVKAYMRRASSHLMIGEESDCNQAIRDYEYVLSNLSPSEEQSKDLKKKIRSAQVQLKRSKRKDFYKILGVPKDATESEIKKCYRKLALKWHPDRHANSSEEKKKEAENTFRDVNLAYEVLSDSTKKRRYDDGVEEQDLDNPHATAGGHGMGGMGGIDPNDLFEMFMRQQAGGGRGGGGGFHFG